MVGKKLRLTQRFQNMFKRLYKGRTLKARLRRSLILLVLLFFLSIPIPLFVTQVSSSTPIVKSQQKTLQLVEQGRKLYQARQFEEAAKVWQQATDAFTAGRDRLNQAMALSNLSLTYQQL